MKRQNTHIKHLPKNDYAELFGWFAAGLILFDYALLSFNVLDGNSIVYHLIFLVGSAGLAVVTFRHRAFQSFTVNSTFMLLGVLALIRIVFFA